MNKLILAVSLLIAGSAMAGKTQVNQDAYKSTSGKTGAFYGRSDGLFQKSSSKSPVIIENAQPVMSVGAGFEMDFTVYADGEGLECSDQAGMGACAGNAALAPCLCSVGGSKFIWMPLLQQDIAPDMDAGSLDIGGDQTDNDGAMLLWGVGGATGKPFVIGRDPGFYMCTKADVADISGIDQNIFAGFVEVQNSEAWNADFEARNSYAGIGVLGTAASGLTLEDITIKTEDDGAGVTSTDTTDSHTEGTPVTYCVSVSNTGVVTYSIDGAAPTVTAAYTFDDGAVVVPFATYLHTNDVAGEIDVYSVRVGYSD